MKRDPSQALWNPAVETLPREALQALQLERLQRQVDLFGGFELHHGQAAVGIDGQQIHPSRFGAGSGWPSVIVTPHLSVNVSSPSQSGGSATSAERMSGRSCSSGMFSASLTSSVRRGTRHRTRPRPVSTTNLRRPRRSNQEGNSTFLFPFSSAPMSRAAFLSFASRAMNSSRLPHEAGGVFVSIGLILRTVGPLPGAVCLERPARGGQVADRTARRRVRASRPYPKSGDLG